MATIEQRWYHPNLTGQGAEQLLNSKGKIGSFLIRPSQSSPNDCTLSFKQSTGITHVRVRRTDELKYCIFPDEVFVTLTELIQYYIEHPVQEKGGHEVQLTAPVYREDAITDLWYQGILHEREAELSLVSKGQIGSFLVRDSTENIGGYVLSVRTYDKVININIIYQNLKFTIDTKAYFQTLTEVINYYREFPLSHKEETLHLIHPFRSTSFTALHIGTRIQELEGIGISFIDEFKMLQDKNIKFLYSHKEGSKLENIHKNRHRSLIPYDHTLVSLTEPDAYGSTYINASYISGLQPDSEHYYIATQGCLDTTIDAFWSMVWQEKVSIIIMLTNLIERGQSKCCQYWPDPNTIDPTWYGKISLITLEETTLEQYTLRHLLVAHDDEMDERHVFQFHFKDWYDYSSPPHCGDLLEFMEQVNDKIRDLKKTDSQSSQKPLIVQCSDGTGHSGTYIAIDSLIKFIEYQGWDTHIDIQRTVQVLRTQRSGLVQTEEQYKFIYQIIYHYLNTNERTEQESPLLGKRNESVYGNIKQGVSPLLKSLYRKRSSPKQSPKLS